MSFSQYPPEKRLMAVDFRIHLFASFNLAGIQNRMDSPGAGVLLYVLQIHTLTDLLKMYSDMKPILEAVYFCI